MKQSSFDYQKETDENSTIKVRKQPNLQIYRISTIRKQLYLDYELSLLVLYVTCNDNSVIYVTAQMCKRTEEEVEPTVGLPTP